MTAGGSRTFPLTMPARLLAALGEADRVVVLTGAGVSAESGVPTFRDARSGLWARFRPEDLATPEAFARDPALVWDWYAWRRELVSAVEPNPAHHALARLEARVGHFALLTQNVDGLHRRAGSRRIVTLHGDLFRTRCSANDGVVETWPPTDRRPPPCPRCGAPLRPDVVWFGEMLPQTALADAFRWSEGCQVFLSVGTSALVQPAASLPLAALRAGAVVMEINPEETPLSALAHHAIRAPAGEVLPALVDAVWPAPGDQGGRV